MSDALEVLPSDTVSFQCTGLTIPGDEKDNLCLQAYRLLQKDYSLPPIQGHLHKTVPMGAGLGGGSADAAHMLRILQAVFGLALSSNQLTAYATKLGSDCAFFLQDQPAIGSGRGEILSPIDLPLKGYYLAVVTPPVHVRTAEAYAGVTPRQPARDVRSVLAEPVAQWKHHLVNDFDASVFRRYPEVEQIRNTMYKIGAIYASMSGSGSSVFGLFATAISREHHFPGLPGWSGWL